VTKFAKAPDRSMNVVPQLTADRGLALDEIEACGDRREHGWRQRRREHMAPCQDRK